MSRTAMQSSRYRRALLGVDVAAGTVERNHMVTLIVRIMPMTPFPFRVVASAISRGKS